MPIEIVVNGAAVKIDGAEAESWLEIWTAVSDRLGSEGWKIAETRIDGQIVADPARAPLDWGDEAVHRVEVTAAPTQEELGRLAGELGAAIPRFRDELTELGNAFARGESRAALEKLTTLLKELQLAFTGLGMTGRVDVTEITRAAHLLQELAPAVERRSWVEVSDLLLYELVPLLDEWNDEH